MYRIKQSVHMMAILALAGLVFAGSLRAEQVPRVNTEDLMEIIAQSRGKVVVVNFWSTWCGPCKREIPELIKLRENMPRDQLEIIGVSLDFNRKMLVSYMDKTNFNYPIYWATREVGVDLNITSIPKLLIYDQSGEMVLEHVGYTPPVKLKKKIDGLLGH